ncbi:hypothetical protein [Arsukibacterium perlucidum]|uniref:FliH/SctL family protein n=1 Tax=Arsukibacterium perlucidum TaxID=368811 RepID=UPI000376228B|nr:hypothetical protein [Arsukibacterium perlucidum]
MTAIKTFVPVRNTAVMKDEEAEKVVPQIHLLLQQMDSNERKQLLVKEFRAELEAVIKQETESAVQIAVEQAQALQQKKLVELEAEHRQQFADAIAQWQALLSGLDIAKMPVNISQEDDLIAIVAEATYRVLTEHLSPSEHLQRIVREAGKEFISDKPARLLLSETDYKLVKDVSVPGNIDIACSAELDSGAYQLELGKAKITYSLTERLSQLASSLLNARAKSND